jgi:hypothetical protein
MSQWMLIWIGVIVSLVGGAIACALFDKFAGTGQGASQPGAPGRIPPWVAGTVERIFFTLLVAFDVSGYPIAMIAWLIAKLAAARIDRGTAYRIPGSLTLLNGLISMTFALIGGVVMQYAMSPDDDSIDEHASFSMIVPARETYLSLLAA